jgi:hypothetical protein
MSGGVILKLGTDAQGLPSIDLESPPPLQGGPWSREPAPVTVESSPAPATGSGAGMYGANIFKTINDLKGTPIGQAGEAIAGVVDPEGWRKWFTDGWQWLMWFAIFGLVIIGLMFILFR